MRQFLDSIEDMLLEYIEWCLDNLYLSIPILIAVLVAINLLFIESEPSLAEGVLEVTQVECGIVPEEKEHSTCLISVRVPDTTVLVNTKYLLMLEPGEELAVPEEGEE